MTTPHGAAAWTVLHVVYRSMQARLRLLAASAPVLDEVANDRRWFFADVPIKTSAGSYHGLELAMLRMPGADAVRAVRAWEQAWTATGLVSSYAVVPAPVVLLPELFPAGVPEHYPYALSVMSSRAIRILEAVLRTGGVRTAASLVQQEIEATYRAIVARPGRRQEVLRWHADWIDAVAAQDRASQQPTHPFEEDGPRLSLPPLPTEQYAAMGQRLESEFLAGSLGDSHPGGRAPYPSGFAILVARLVHIQVVRLWGPERPGALWQESAFVRALAAEDALRRTHVRNPPPG